MTTALNRLLHKHRKSFEKNKLCVCAGGKSCAYQLHYDNRSVELVEAWMINTRKVLVVLYVLL